MNGARLLQGVFLNEYPLAAWSSFQRTNPWGQRLAHPKPSSEERAVANFICVLHLESRAAEANGVRPKVARRPRNEPPFASSARLSL